MAIGATLFSGGRGVELRLRDRVDFRYAVEYDQAIAAVGAQLGGHTFVSRVEDVDYSTWGALDYLHASPVCKEYSQAKTNGAEGESDLSSAAAVVRCLEATQPRVFTLENVGAYQYGQAYRSICTWLNQNGYMWHAEVLNSADFGVPQTRRRLILRAVRDSLLPSLPPPVPWVGWYSAIEDLIPTLPDSAFAPWQLARLPEEFSNFAFGNNAQEWGDSIVFEREPFHAITGQTGGRSRAFIVSNAATMDVRESAEPMVTVTATTHSKAAMPRAWFVNEDSKMGVYAGDEPAPTQVSSARARKARALLIDCTHRTGGDLTVRGDTEPAHTIAASHFRRPANEPRAWLSQGRVVKMSARALARFQSFPDWYILPEKTSLACKIIGNAVPSLMMQKIVEQLL